MKKKERNLKRRRLIKKKQQERYTTIVSYCSTCINNLFKIYFSITKCDSASAREVGVAGELYQKETLLS
jgi:hypothetical protein